MYHCISYILVTFNFPDFFFFLNLWFISSAFSVQFKTECSFYTTISSEHDFKILFLAKLPAVSLSLNFFLMRKKTCCFCLFVSYLIKNGPSGHFVFFLSLFCKSACFHSALK